MTDAPFFDPWPDPDPEQEDSQQEIDLPWISPSHVAGVVVPVELDVFRGDNVLVRVSHVVAYQRGFELHVSTWLRPGTRRPDTSQAPFWQVQEPRIGVRLADGTRLGHRPSNDPQPPVKGPATYFTQLSGHGGGLRSSSSWWVHPLPEGDTLEVVVEWEHQRVPESSARVDLGALRDAAAREDVLWDPPPAPEEGFFGWAGYAPTSGEAYKSSLTITFDGDENEDS